MGSTVKKIAGIALPVIGMMTPLGPVVGGMVGGALGGIVSGGGLKGALIGGAMGGIGGGIMKGLGGTGGFGNFFGGASTGLGQAGGKMAGLMGQYGAGTATNLGLASGALGSSATAARLATLSPVTSAIKGPQSFLASSLASKGGYTPQLSTLGTSPVTLGKNIVGHTTSQGVRTPQLSPRQAIGPSGTGMKLNREFLKEAITSGYSAYEGNIQQQQLDALRKNLGQYRSEYGEYYASEAKKHQEKLARGELPETYNAALDREAERLKRLLVAQGHNPAESGFGRDQFKRGLMDLESKFIGAERSYWTSVAGGADTMTANIATLEGQLAERNIGARSTTQAIGNILDTIV